MRKISPELQITSADLALVSKEDETPYQRGRRDYANLGEDARNPYTTEDTRRQWAAGFIEERTVTLGN